jgi:hypothetical protein
MLVLFGPLVSRATFDELSVLAADRDVVVFLTYNGHERSSPEIAQRFAATVYAPEVSCAPLSGASTPLIRRRHASGLERALATTFAS